MLHFKSKKITGLCLISVLIFPGFAQAEPTGTGSIAAIQAAEQKAALAKKAALREAKKAAQAQTAAETPKPAEPQKEESTAK